MCDYQSAPSHNLVLSRAVRGKLVVCGVDQAMHMYPSRSADFCESDFIACARARVCVQTCDQPHERTFSPFSPFQPYLRWKGCWGKGVECIFFLALRGYKSRRVLFVHGCRFP